MGCIDITASDSDNRPGEQAQTQKARRGGIQAGNPPTFDPAILPKMQVLWETSDLTAAQIGERLGVSKNVVIGQAGRRGWVKGNDHTEGDRLKPITTMMQRLDALHATLDAVLRDNPIVRRPAEPRTP